MRVLIFIGLVSAGLIFLFIGILILHPLYANVCAIAGNHAQQECHPNNVLYIAFLYVGKTITHAEFWTACATVAIAAFTLTLKWSTDRLWAAGEKQFNLARDEFRSTHRPKIRVKHFFLANDVWGGKPIIVNMTLVNYGTAEAIPRQIGLKYFVVRKDRQLPIEPSITPIFHGTGQRMAVGKNLNIENVDAKKTLTDEENADIQQGRSRLFAVGYVSYEDEAGKTRITGFCRVLRFPPNALAHTGNCRFRRFPDPDYEYED